MTAIPHHAGVLAAERVVHPLTKNNLVRNLHQYIRAAGLTAWKKPYQALRSSCENDFKTAGVAEPTYLAILGHSLEVSRKHYVSPTDAELDALAGGAA